MNPFEPPKTTVTDAPAPPGSPILAVFLGLLVDIGGTLAFGVLFGIAIVMAVVEPDMPPDVMGERMGEIMQSGWATVLNMVVGSGLSVLGGFVCARVSKRRGYRDAGVLAACSVAIGLLLNWGSQTPLEHLGLVVLTIACVLLGYRLGMVRAAGPVGVGTGVGPRPQG